MLNQTWIEIQNERYPTNGRCHRRGWRRLDTGHIVYNQHAFTWWDGCYYALPLARQCLERNTQHSGIVYDPTTKALTTNTTKYIKVYHVSISVHRFTPLWTHLRLIEYDFFARWRCSSGRDRLPAQNRKLRIQHRPG